MTPLCQTDTFVCHMSHHLTSYVTSSSQQYSRLCMSYKVTPSCQTDTNVTHAYDDVTHAYDDVTHAYDDVTHIQYQADTFVSN